MALSFITCSMPSAPFLFHSGELRSLSYSLLSCELSGPSSLAGIRHSAALSACHAKVLQFMPCVGLAASRLHRVMGSLCPPDLQVMPGTVSIAIV